MTESTHEALALRLERVIPAPPNRVFAAWSDPDLLRQWATPPWLASGEGMLELRVGGAWSIVMIEPSGRRMRAFGVYREVTPPSRLVYTHQWDGPEGTSPETTVVVEFIAEGDGTRVMLTQTGFENAPSRDGHQQGWSEALDQLPLLLSRD